MQTEIMIAGFGGQGVLFAGQLLAYTAMDEGKQVTWIPSYGPEMRGGTANCTVVIADEEIGSPMVRHPQAVVAMNRPSLDKYEHVIQAGGVLVINSSMVDRAVERSDVRVVLLPASEIAEELGDRRMSNMVLLGGLLANLPVLSLDALRRSLHAHLPVRHHRLLPLNVQAMQRGAQYQAVPV
jgi:2-oxoglutarate ferredoxin oxidoreductase subunit gamma